MLKNKPTPQLNFPDDEKLNNFTSHENRNIMF